MDPADRITSVVALICLKTPVESWNSTERKVGVVAFALGVCISRDT